jgi:3-dehydroquinate synthetase
MLMATNLSKKILNLEKKEIDKIKQLIYSILSEELLKSEFQPNDLVKLMSADKKKKGDSLNFILLSSIGEAKILSDIQESDIIESIKLT